MHYARAPARDLKMMPAVTVTLAVVDVATEALPPSREADRGRGAMKGITVQSND